jgi:hypothetical protein
MLQPPSPSSMPKTAAFMPDLSFSLNQRPLLSFFAARQRKSKTNDCACSSCSLAKASWSLRWAISSAGEKRDMSWKLALMWMTGQRGRTLAGKTLVIQVGFPAEL